MSGRFRYDPKDKIKMQNGIRLPCNLANFISVNWEPEVGQGGSGGRTRGEKKKGREKERKE